MNKITNKIAKTLFVGLLGSAMLLPAHSVSAAEDYTAVKERLKQMVAGDADSAVISKSTIPGLYQVQLGLTVVYMSKDGKHLLNGNIIDLDTKKNLTKAAQAKVRKGMLAKLSEDSMVVYPAKDPKHTITIFTDIDCPYCRKLHKEIPALNAAGVNVRYLAYPRSGVVGRDGKLTESYQKLASVWCADDKAKMMDDAMAGLPPEKKQCDNPVQEHMLQAQMFEVNGTPNIIFENGDLVPGYAPAKEILKLLKES